jgi:amino acid transporter
MTAYRIIFVFIATIFFISLVVPYDNPDLVGGNSDANNSRQYYSTV